MTDIKTDKGACDRAEQLVREAFRVFVQGTHLSSPVSQDCSQDCVSCRALVAIRHFAGLFYEQAVAYGLEPDLKITLDLICQGLEDKIPDDLREIWVQMESDQNYEPWVLPDFRTLLGKGEITNAG
jgi:hypothetical protein